MRDSLNYLSATLKKKNYGRRLLKYRKKNFVRVLNLIFIRRIIIKKP
jgi:hypothetical protein